MSLVISKADIKEDESGKVTFTCAGCKAVVPLDPSKKKDKQIRCINCLKIVKVKR